MHHTHRLISNRRRENLLHDFSIVNWMSLEISPLGADLSLYQRNLFFTSLSPSGLDLYLSPSSNLLLTSSLSKEKETVTASTAEKRGEFHPAWHSHKRLRLYTSVTETKGRLTYAKERKERRRGENWEGIIPSLLLFNLELEGEREVLRISGAVLA